MTALLAAEKFWILDPLYAAFGWVLASFYAFIPSFGVAIMLLTVTVSILRMPLVAKQVKSQQEMQRIQPELKRIQAKYKTEPQKRNEELMKLYKEHSVNPFAGCLPLILQMPLFIVLYRLILDLGRPEPKHIPVDSSLHQALVESGGRMQSFGMDLAQAASKVSDFGKLLPYLVVIALVIGTGLFQARQMTARLPKDAMNSQMMIMGKVFPAFLGLISWSIPAGVVLYFFVSNVWQIGQQAVLFRRQDERKAAEAAEGPSGKGGKGGKGRGKAAKEPRTREVPGAAPGDGAAAGATGAQEGPTKAGAKPTAKPTAKANDRRAGGKPAPKAGARDGKANSKRNRRSTDARGAGGGGGGASGSNGRPSSGASGRAQAKGTPQGRSRPGRGNSRKGK